MGEYNVSQSDELSGFNVCYHHNGSRTRGSQGAGAETLAAMGLTVSVDSVFLTRVVADEITVFFFARAPNATSQSSRNR
jgi:hypothetical protein